MANDRRFEFGAIKLDVGLGSEPAAEPTPNDPFGVVILGDFSGRGSRSDALVGRSPVKIDRDNFDEVLRLLAPELELPGAGRIAISELDDFHPDRLFEHQPFFAPLREARRSGGGPAPAAPSAKTRPATSSPPPASLLSGSLLESVVQATEGSNQSQAPSDPLRVWIDQQVVPHVIPAASAADSEREALVDRDLAAQMRAVLHAPPFQSLEALWRGIYFLARRTDTDGPVSLWLADITLDELARDFASVSAVADLPVYRSISSKRPALLIGAFGLGVTDADLATLAGLGALGAALSASCLTGAQPQWIGCERYEALGSPREWASTRAEAEMFRSSAAARHAGLAAPRFLLRLPYGSKTDACESFPFEEMGDAFEHDRLLWGNSAILCACLLAESFNEDGWDLRPGTRSNVDGLPVYIHDSDGETVAQPCAETIMTDHAARAMMERGVMCIASLQGSDAVHLVRFQNVAAPAGPLAGPWSK